MRKGREEKGRRKKTEREKKKTREGREKNEKGKRRKGEEEEKGMRKGIEEKGRRKKKIKSGRKEIQRTKKTKKKKISGITGLNLDTTSQNNVSLILGQDAEISQDTNLAKTPACSPRNPLTPYEARRGEARYDTLGSAS